jgi:NAD(P)H-hydrate epimerase
MKIPALTTQQMIEVDRLMIEEFGITLLQIMENAGRNLAELARRMLGGDARGKRVAVFCGNGNNGGGGLVAVRHLHDWGAEVLYQVVSPDRLKDTPAHQLKILEAMQLKNEDTIALEGFNLVIDALIGYGLTGNPRGLLAEWIKRINASNQKVLALDNPSGLDTTTGNPGNPCIRATATLTLALPKAGLRTEQAKPWVGELYLADIGVPPELYKRPTLNISVGNIFSSDTIVRVDEE